MRDGLEDWDGLFLATEDPGAAVGMIEEVVRGLMIGTGWWNRFEEIRPRLESVIRGLQKQLLI